MVFVYADIAAQFHVLLPQRAFIRTATLLMRPVGALLFGMWANRSGRRIPLLVDVSFCLTVGFLRAFAPNFTVPVIPRLLYGIGMGGDWGSVPHWRWKSPAGFCSGVLGQGYAIGYLMASIVTLLVLDLGGPGWR